MSDDNKQKRILGVDYGSKRIGIAISDETRRFALPVSVLENSPVLFDEIAKLAVDYGFKEIVLGESRNYKGEANDIMIDALDFKDKLEEKGYIVYLEPEFMTSMHAERLQGENKMTDASAAALILQTYLDKNADK